MMGGPMMMGPMIGPQGFPQGMMGPLINPDQMGNSPGMNDAPLEFNMNKNKPPMPLTSKRTIARFIVKRRPYCQLD